MKMRSDLKPAAGMRFGGLTAIEAVRDGRGRAAWRCVCDCGGERVMLGCNLRRMPPIGCSACVTAARIARKRTHGHVGSSEYGIFMTMKTRCTNPASKKYRNYGAAGIRCLFKNFDEFFAELGPRPSRKHSVDRKDPIGDYAPGNVRWATATEQQANKRPRRQVFSITREDILGLARSPLSFGA